MPCSYSNPWKPVTPDSMRRGTISIRFPSQCHNIRTPAFASGSIERAKCGNHILSSDSMLASVLRPSAMSWSRRAYGGRLPSVYARAAAVLCSTAQSARAEKSRSMTSGYSA